MSAQLVDGSLARTSLPDAVDGVGAEVALVLEAPVALDVGAPPVGLEELSAVGTELPTGPETAASSALGGVFDGITAAAAPLSSGVDGGAATSPASVEEGGAEEGGADTAVVALGDVIPAKRQSQPLSQLESG